jgi:hypothetical protein
MTYRISKTSWGNRSTICTMISVRSMMAIAIAVMMTTILLINTQITKAYTDCSRPLTQAGLKAGHGRNNTSRYRVLPSMSEIDL